MTSDKLTSDATPSKYEGLKNIFNFQYQLVVDTTSAYGDGTTKIAAENLFPVHSEAFLVAIEPNKKKFKQLEINLNECGVKHICLNNTIEHCLNNVLEGDWSPWDDLKAIVLIDPYASVNVNDKLIELSKKYPGYDYWINFNELRQKAAVTAIKNSGGGPAQLRELKFKAGLDPELFRINTFINKLPHKHVYIEYFKGSMPWLRVLMTNNERDDLLKCGFIDASSKQGKSIIEKCSYNKSELENVELEKERRSKIALKACETRRRNNLGTKT